MRWILLIGALLPVYACSVYNVCEPGEQAACACQGGGQGVQICLADGSGWGECDCACVPDCTGKDCGDDGCSGSCGSCGAGEVCSDGRCECAFEECEGACCADGQRCYRGACCTPDCAGRCCGDDGCGGQCQHSCPTGTACNATTCECEPVARETGLPCTDHDQCASGLCLRYTGQAEGYCTETDCGSDAECVNHSDDGVEMCCVEIDVAFFFCLKIGPGCQCGDGSGACGSSCTCTSDSACQPGFPCLATSIMDPDAICSKLCMVDRDCDDCVGSDPADEFECVPISGGDKYCLLIDGRGCDRNLDCPSGEVCLVDVIDDMLRGTCGRMGALDPGAACNDEDDPDSLPYDERCAAVFCFNGMCSSVCTLDSDCPQDMTCETVGFIDMPDQTIDMCMGPPPQGPQGPGDPCIYGSVNADTGHCQSGLACLGYDPAQLGVSCDSDVDCESIISPVENPDCTAQGLCGASFCSPPCDVGNECQSGFYPALVEGQCYCIPQETGSSGPGDPCPFMGVHMDAPYCESGLACLGYDREAVNAPCEADEDCMDVLPPAQNPECSAQDDLCGASFCSPPCDANDECQAGFYPSMAGDQCYCIPQETGSSGAGDPCPFQGTHVDAAYCESGLTCLGYDREALNAPCETDEDCTGALPPAQNPECAEQDGLCGASFCSPPCDANDQCQTGFYPSMAGDQCYCIPETNGTSGAGDPCPFQGTHMDAPYCESGLTCLGYDRGAINEPCETDEDCMDVLPPAENPDCSEQDSLCGASFCSPPCDENDQCEAGFYPAEISDLCYCIPATRHTRLPM
ncbi:MAG: hypothetical protein JXR96_25625 [Deltaproteobacteria bacterium]|nr:hypothetical protein [Deltaproteobacteria bacterium]